MGTILNLTVFILLRLSLAGADTYSVKIRTEEHVNLVDSKFLSFTIDPKYLFSSSDRYNNKECICMASSLTPAYLRIAGPSTSHMSFYNTTISINEVDFHDHKPKIIDFDISNAPKKVALDFHTKNLAVSHWQWKKFVHWAKSTGFDLVFALNNEERTASGMWDPNTALNILTVAEKVKVGDIFWELGYECTNQSIEEYLNDLETLRVSVDTFPPGRTGEWKVVAGDVTKCLQADSKSDFKDYLTLSNDMMDALLLNANSTSYELDQMPEYAKLKLLRFLSRSETPLWLIENNNKKYNELERAADWLTSLGYSAKQGFAVYYRELEEEEMYEPTLSFYMALLFKNLVGERVLDVDMDPEQAILFAHCTSLRHKPIPRAVTLFGVNMDEEPARFSIKLSQREEGGEIMQFILGNDHNGNIVVNERAMYYAGDIRPVVKRVMPYRTLLLNLPAKSFGFWVVANTNIEACQDVETNNTLVEAETITLQSEKVKRSVDNDFDDYTHIADLSYDFEDADAFTTENDALNNRVSEMNKDLEKLHDLLQRNKIINNRFKRDEESSFGLLRKLGLRNKSPRRHDIDLSASKRLIGDILEKARQSVGSIKGIRNIRPKLNLNRKSKRHSKSSRLRSKLSTFRDEAKAYRKPLQTKKFAKPSYGAFEKRKRKNTFEKYSQEDDIFNTANFGKRKNKIEKPVAQEDIYSTPEHGKRKSKVEKDVPKETDILEKNKKVNEDLNKISAEVMSKEVRKRRSVDNEVQEISAENEIDFDSDKRAKLWKILKKLNEELRDYSPEQIENDNENESSEGLVLRTELSDDSATIKVKDSNHGVIKSTMKNMLHVLEDLNKNLNKVWSAINLLD